MFRSSLLGFLVSASLLLGGCGFFWEGGGEGGTPQEEVQEVKGTSLTVFSQEGEPLQSALVIYRVDSNDNGVIEEGEEERFAADSQGRVLLPEEVNHRRVIEVKVPGYVPLVKSLEPGKPLPQALSLKRIEATQDVEIKSLEGKAFVKTPLVEIEIPESSRAYRLLPSVSKVEVGVINPGSEPERMPADFKGYWQGPSILSSTGAFFVEFYDESGWPVELPEGEYRVKVKVLPDNYSGLEDFDPSTPEVEIPLWYLNEKEGLWERNSEIGYLVDSEGNRVTRDRLTEIVSDGEEVELFVEGTVKHFSFINCDIPTRPAGISGKLVGLDRCDDVYLEVVGVNWNGGQGGNRANPDCTFTLPVPFKEFFPQVKKECFFISLSSILKMLDRIEEIESSPTLSETCKKEWEEIKRSFERAAALYKYMMDLFAESDAVSDSDRRAMREIGYNFMKAVKEGKYSLAYDYLLQARKIWTENINMSAEDFMKIYSDLVNKTYQDVANTLLGIPLSPPDSGAPPATFSDFFKQVVETAAANRNSCLAPIASAVYDVGVDEAKNAFYAISSGQQVDISVQKVAINIVGKFAENAIDSKTGKLNQNFIDCIKQFPSLSKYASSLESLSSTAAKRLGSALFLANVLATAIQEGFDSADALQRVKKGEFVNLYDSYVRAAVKVVKDSYLNLDPECLPEDIPSLSKYASYVKECKASDGFDRQVEEELSQLPSGEEVRGTWKPFKDLVDFLNLAGKTQQALNAVSGGPSSYSQWAGGEEPEPITLPAGLPGDPSSFGGYLSQLQITVPHLGVYHVPVVDITSVGVDTQMIPSPGVPAQFNGQLITAWIGEVDVSSSLSTTTGKVVFEFDLPKGVEIEKVERIYLKDSRGVVIPVNFFGCSYNGDRATCTMPLFTGFMRGVEGVSAVFLFNDGGNRVSLTGIFDGVDLTGSTPVEVKLYRCESPEIAEFSAPSQVESDSALEAKVSVKLSRYLSFSACTDGPLNYVWYLGRVKLSEGSPELSVKTPDKYTMAKMGTKALLRVEVSKGSFKVTRSRWVELKVKNNPPVISLVELPSEVPPTESTFRASAQVSDPDGDRLTYRWFAFPTGVVAVKEGMGDLQAAFSVNHSDSDVKGKVCLEVSDGLDRSVECRELVIKKRSYPPKILSVSVSAGSFVAPAQVEFRVQTLSSEPVNLFKVKVVGLNTGESSYTFSSSPFTLTFDSPGEYRVEVVARSESGLESEPYTLPLSISESPSLLLSSRIEELTADGVKLSFDLSGASSLGASAYFWDLNGDGAYEFTTDSPELEAVLKVKELSGVDSFSLLVKTPYGDYRVELPLSQVPPYASLTVSPTEGFAPLEVSFTVSAFSLSATPVKYYYDFDGDGVYELESSAPTVSHTYTLPGAYSPAVKVVFSDGREALSGGAVKVNSKGSLVLYRLTEGYFTGPKELAFNGSDALFMAGYRDGSSQLGYLLTLLELSDGVKVKETGFFNLPVSSGSLTAFADGYLLVAYGSYCLNSDCSDRVNGNCVLKLYGDNTWYSCFRNTRYAVAFSKAVSSGDRIYLYYPGHPDIAVLSASDGSLVGVYRIAYEGNALAVDFLRGDSDALYLFGSLGDKEVLLKLNPDLSVVYAKSFGYTEGYSLKPYFKASTDDGLNIYAVFGHTLWLSRYANVLVKFRKEDGELLFSKQVLYRCPYYCVDAVDLKSDENYLYLAGSYRYWGNPEQYLIRLGKDGSFSYASTFKLCKVNDCSNPVFRLTLSGDSLYLFGTYDDSEEGVKGFYAIGLLKDSGLGCSDYTSPADVDEVGFGGDVELRVDSYGPSAFSVEEVKDWAGFEPSFGSSTIPAPFELYLECK